MLNVRFFFQSLGEKWGWKHFNKIKIHLILLCYTLFVSFHSHKHSLRSREVYASVTVCCRKTTKRRPELVCFTVCSCFFRYSFICVVFISLSIVLLDYDISLSHFYSPTYSLKCWRKKRNKERKCNEASKSVHWMWQTVNGHSAIELKT